MCYGDVHGKFLQPTNKLEVLSLVAVMKVSSYFAASFERLVINVVCCVCRYCNIPTNWQPPKKKEFVERVSVMVWRM